MLESKFRQKWCKELRDIGSFIIPYVGNARQLSGTPDIYLAHRKWCGFIEFKGKDTRIEEHQVHVMRILRDKGVHCFVFRYPNLLQSPIGETLCIVKDAWDLLLELRRLSDEESTATGS